jgi:hypothetical protein
MRPHNRSARTGRREPERASPDPFTALAFEELGRPPPHLAKDFLGAAATLAIIGVILLQVTNSLASQCRARLSPRTGSGACSGMSAIANHADGAVTWGVAACAMLAAVAFVWYMFWGYKANEHIGSNRKI